jgi:hypothetical protein
LLFFDLFKLFLRIGDLPKSAATFSSHILPLSVY